MGAEMRSEVVATFGGEIRSCGYGFCDRVSIVQLRCDTRILDVSSKIPGISMDSHERDV
jgi:hypothetical protein